jgi:uncharacterized protein YktA (UPF0223 family)
MAEEYSYPIDVDWSTDEVIDVVKFYEAIETGYNEGIKKKTLEERYRNFKNVVPSKAEEKTMFKTFEKASGYAPFQLIKQLQNAKDDEKIHGKAHKQ